MVVVGGGVVPEFVGALDGGVNGESRAGYGVVDGAGGVFSVGVANDGGEGEARGGMAGDVVNGEAKVEGQDGAAEEVVVLIQASPFLEGGGRGSNQPVRIEDEELFEVAGVSVAPDEVDDAEDGAAVKEGKAVVVNTDLQTCITSPAARKVFPTTEISSSPSLRPSPGT